ncbi:MAG: hypothetical protein NT166_00460 [Candidatus Aminicenantes bacterium]|nr:hypothetical protein [Candidatus Aminicenantes bacterium]
MVNERYGRKGDNQENALLKSPKFSQRSGEWDRGKDQLFLSWTIPF